MRPSCDEEEADHPSRQRLVHNVFHPKPVDVSSEHGEHIFLATPFLGPLLFDNTDSDARDHCANERTFLSYLRLSIYMSVVAIAVIISFHLKSQPSELELRMALPVGVIFWALGVACLVLGFGNYVKTVTKYSLRLAIVQTGWKTQLLFSTIAICIVAICILFLSTNTQK